MSIIDGVRSFFSCLFHHNQIDDGEDSATIKIANQSLPSADSSSTPLIGRVDTQPKSSSSIFEIFKNIFNFILGKESEEDAFFKDLERLESAQELTYNDVNLVLSNDRFSKIADTNPGPLGKEYSKYKRYCELMSKDPTLKTFTKKDVDYILRIHKLREKAENLKPDFEENGASVETIFLDLNKLINEKDDKNTAIKKEKPTGPFEDPYDVLKTEKAFSLTDIHFLLLRQDPIGYLESVEKNAIARSKSLTAIPVGTLSTSDVGPSQQNSSNDLSGENQNTYQTVHMKTAPNSLSINSVEISASEIQEEIELLQKDNKILQSNITNINFLLKSHENLISWNTASEIENEEDNEEDDDFDENLLDKQCTEINKTINKLGGLKKLESECDYYTQKIEENNARMAYLLD